MGRVTIEDFYNEVDFLRKQYQQLDRRSGFCLWFLLAQVVETESAALNALTGESGDKSLDAIVVDHDSKTVYFVQTKLRDSLGKKPEDRKFLNDFASLAGLPLRNDSDLRLFFEKLAPRGSELLQNAIMKIKSGDYSLHLYYVTTGRCSQTVTSDAVSTARQANDKAAFEIIDSHAIGSVLEDYLAGMAPPPGLVRLSWQSDQQVLKRAEAERGVITWLLTMPTKKIADLYKSHGRRLFARNIRGYLGAGSKVNSDLVTTLKEEPSNFWYYNNGVTIICDRAEMKDSLQGKVLEIFRPQIINGQQTTRAISDSPPSDAEVLVKVIAISRDGGGSVRYEDLLSKIVRATNWQNEIKQSDFGCER